MLTIAHCTCLSAVFTRRILRLVSRRRIGGLAALGGAFFAGGCGSNPDLGAPRIELAGELRALTGARTRVVWVQDVEGKGDLFGRFARTALIGFDTDDNAGDRLLLKETGYYAKPLITPKGDRVVYSNFRDLETWIVNWNGSGLRKIADGKAVEVWLDRQTGKEWVYIQRGPARDKDFKENPIFQHEIDNPGNVMLAWEESPVSAFAAGSFQVSADGKRAAGLFPWGDAGVADLETSTWERIGSGCWTGMAPDNTYRPWIFDGAHRNLFIAAPDGTTTAKIALAPMTDNARGEVYHPRWSSHPRFLVLTSPYFLKEGSGIVGNPRVEVVVGRFNAAYNAVESWVQVTRNGRGDYFPDMWVERDPLDEQPEGFPTSVASGSNEGRPAWPGDLGGLVFRWENAAKKNAVLDPATEKERLFRVRARGYGRIGRYHVMDMTGGQAFFEVENVDAKLIDALRGGYGFSVEATIIAMVPTVTPAPLITLGDDIRTSDFVLMQDGDALVCRFRTEEKGKVRRGELRLGAISIGDPVHVAITYAPWGQLRGFIDGREVAGKDAISGSVKNWTAKRMTFGGGNAGSSWSGCIDGVAIYDAGLDPQQIECHAKLNAARIEHRTKPDGIEVVAKLEEITPVPSPEAIAPYRRCLLIHRYRVEQVISGTEQSAGDEILVAHWGILDGEIVPEGTLQEGASYRLRVEPFEDHPQLVSERTDMSTTAFDLPLYYDPLPGALAVRAVQQRKQRGVDDETVGAAVAPAGELHEATL